MSPSSITTVLGTQQVPNKDVLRGDFLSCHFQKVPVADNTIWAVSTICIQPCRGATAAPGTPNPGSLLVAHFIIKQVSRTPRTFSVIRAGSEQGLYL